MPSHTFHPTHTGVDCARRISISGSSGSDANNTTASTLAMLATFAATCPPCDWPTTSTSVHTCACLPVSNRKHSGSRPSSLLPLPRLSRRRRLHKESLISPGIHAHASSSPCTRTRKSYLRKALDPTRRAVSLARSRPVPAHNSYFAILYRGISGAWRRTCRMRPFPRPG